LVEHQSKAEELMPLRIIRYQIAIIQQHMDKHPKQKNLPMVVPIVFYNGMRSPYPYSSDIAEIFADPELYVKFPLGKFKLVDLTMMNEDEILKHGKLALLEMLAKHIHDRNFMEAIKFIVAAFQLGHNLEMNKGLVHAAFNYLINAREMDEIKDLLIELERNVPEYKEDFMTYAESLKREGMQLGKQEGMQLGEQRGMQLGEQRGMQLGEQRGMQLGKQEAQKEIAKELLKSGVNDSVIAAATHLTLDQIKSLS
jgi:predicted transposase/invertase (TIGR01784 family)